MGSPVLSILDEILLPETENKYCLNIIWYRRVVYVTRYVDDILIIFDASNTTSEPILVDSCAMHQKLK